MGSLRFNKTKMVTQYKYPGTKRGQAKQNTIKGDIKTKVGMLWVEIEFKVLCERNNIGGMHKSHQEEQSTQWEHQKQNYNEIVSQTFK